MERFWYLIVYFCFVSKQLNCFSVKNGSKVPDKLGLEKTTDKIASGKVLIPDIIDNNNGKNNKTLKMARTAASTYIDKKSQTSSSSKLLLKMGFNLSLSTNQSLNSNVSTSFPVNETTRKDNRSLLVDDHGDLSKEASLIVGVGFIPGILLLFIFCRYVPDWCTKMAAYA